MDRARLIHAQRCGWADGGGRCFVWFGELVAHLDQYINVPGANQFHRSMRVCHQIDGWYQRIRFTLFSEKPPPPSRLIENFLTSYFSNFLAAEHCFLAKHNSA